MDERDGLLRAGGLSLQRGVIQLLREDFEGMEKLARVQLATSLPGVKPICLVGTLNKQGQDNLAPFSSVLHLGSSPMLLGMVTRPDTVERHTLSNILELEEWTLSHVKTDFVEKAHQCSARYPREISEFDAVGLERRVMEGMMAPAVGEARVRIGLGLEEIVDLKINNTKLIIGSVRVVEIEGVEELIDGRVDLEKLGTMGSTALDTYFEVKGSRAFDYAKP